MHYHKSYSELFTAVEGTVGLELRNKKHLYLKPGESYLVKKGEWHRFFNASDTTITFINKVEPASSGLENTLRILCGLASDDLYNSRNIPKDIFHMAICGDMSDMRLTGLAGVITTPLIKLLAYLGRKMGIEKQLVEKYCV